MHIVTFWITVFELIMLFFQVIYFFQRTNDKSRLQYLVLLIFLILHNVISGFFPDKNIPIPINIQLILAFMVGFTMSMYVVYYFYKAFDLKQLRFFATYGSIIFLFLPFIFLFVVPFLLTGDLRLSRKLTVIIPFLYGLAFIYNVTRALINKFSGEDHRTESNNGAMSHLVSFYISMIFWSALPVIVFFGGSQLMAHSVANAGFLMMTIIYVRSGIEQSRSEYKKLLESERNLKLLNEGLKRRVRQRTKKLERIMEERQTTFINLAHETKTPLTLINNYLSDYISRYGMNEEIQIVQKNISRLTSDIVNFFDVESYEKGFKVYDQNQICDFSLLLNTKMPLFVNAANRRNIKLNSSIEPRLRVKAHPGAIDRITNNLIENAVKYSRKDGRIDVRLCKEVEKAVFLVKDNGVGIPEELHQRVFEPYFKLSIPGSNNDGMGMGLSIVKRIVEDINGEIQFSSSAGIGTTIKVVLGLVGDSAEPSQSDSAFSTIQHDYNPDQVGDTISDPDKKFILIVEDNVEMLNFLVSRLKDKYNVVTALNGKDALIKLKDLSALDLIISDVMMNEMDGFEFYSEVYSQEKFSHIPFIFLTAKATGLDKVKGLSMGAVDYIEKPFKVEELTLKIESIISNNKKQRAAVIHKAYQAILVDNNVSSNATANSNRRPFSENCEKYHMTSREVEIVKLLIKGLPYKLIASELHISDKTVNKHISNIFAKVGVNNKVELIGKLEGHELLNR